MPGVHGYVHRFHIVTIVSKLGKSSPTYGTDIQPTGFLGVNSSIYIQDIPVTIGKDTLESLGHILGCQEPNVGITTAKVVSQLGGGRWMLNRVFAPEDPMMDARDEQYV